MKKKSNKNFSTTRLKKTKNFKEINKMNYSIIIQELTRNKDVFKDLLTGIEESNYLFKPENKKWCLLEIICHLYDEEREDFRIRLKHVLDASTNPLPSINPREWVQEREYIKQNFSDKLDNFLKEREKSIKWLQSLQSPKWDNYYNHPKFGKMTAKMFLSNWLAHDYLHIRQILKLKFDYLSHQTNESLNYAGNW